MKVTDKKSSGNVASHISNGEHVVLGEIFDHIAIGMPFSPVQFVSKLNTANRKALLKLVERAKNGEISEESFQKHWLAHHASDQITLMTSIADLIHQLSYHLPGRKL